MKILLIDPPYAVFTGYANRYFPVGLAYIGSVLRDNGYDVAIYEADRDRHDIGDLNFSEEYKRLEKYRKEINSDDHFAWKRIAEVVNEHEPDIAGITATTMKFGSVVKTAQICKNVKSDVIVVVGGPHATDWPEVCLQSPHIDFCLSGEAEEVMPAFLKTVNDKRADFQRIEGLSFKRNNQAAIRKNNPCIANLDKYPYPARDLLLNQARYSGEDMGVIMTSRGCPYRCSFCSHNRQVRYRSLDNVIGEIKHIKARYKTQQFAIKDDSFTVNRKRVIEFCTMLEREKLGINWDCTTRGDLVDDQLLGIMQRAGCNTIKLGIETGSERILKKVNKAVTLEQIRSAANMLNRRGIFWSGYFMYGLPTETEEDMLKTLEFMKELNPPYGGLGLYAPMPNTQLWRQGLELGLINPDINIDHFFKTNPKDYFFKDYKKRVVDVDYENFIKLAAYLMKEFNKHNTSWKRLLARGWSRRTAYRKDAGFMMHDIKKVFKWMTY